MDLREKRKLDSERLAGQLAQVKARTRPWRSITGILIGIAAQQTMANLSAGLAPLAAALEASQDVTGDAPAIADLDSAALGPGADLGAALAVSGRPAPALGSLDRRLACVLGELSYHLAKPLAVPGA
jgi:hypothetical protein